MKGSQTKARLLQFGIDLASVAGISGVTLGQLAQASGLSKSGLFAHFRSKEQLQIELLDRVAEAADKVVFEPAKHARPGLLRLMAVVDLWFGWPRRAGLTGGCPLAAAFFELDDLEGDVRAHVATLEARWRELLRQFVQEAVVEGDLSSDTDLDQFVWELCGIYLAHHVSSRFAHSEDADARAKRAIVDLVERNRPPAVSGSAV